MTFSGSTMKKPAVISCLLVLAAAVSAQTGTITSHSPPVKRVKINDFWDNCLKSCGFGVQFEQNEVRFMIGICQVWKHGFTGGPLECVYFLWILLNRVPGSSLNFLLNITTGMITHTSRHIHAHTHLLYLFFCELCNSYKKGLLFIHITNLG